MAKRFLHSLGNEEFAFLVNRIGEKLKDTGIPYNFVGGTAVQAHILHRLTQKYHTDVKSLVENKHIRFQDYVRATDDIDFALLFPDNAQNPAFVSNILRKFYDGLDGVYLSHDEKHLFEYQFARRGERRPVLEVTIDDHRAEDIALNISQQSRHLRSFGIRFYDEFIMQGKNLVIPYTPGYDLNLRVCKPEHILATKISQFRAKDTMDIQNLVNVMQDVGETIDTEELRKILLPVHYDNLVRFNSLTRMDVDLSMKAPQAEDASLIVSPNKI